MEPIKSSFLLEDKHDTNCLHLEPGRKKKAFYLFKTKLEMISDSSKKEEFHIQ